mgnify:CR=1 FL=1
MQRILQPGDIEALDRTQLPRIRLPQPASLFADRAARLAQKAEGNPIGDYLRFLARLVRAQQQAAGTVQTATPDPALIAQAQEHSMALLPAAQHIDPAWQGVLDQLLAALDGAPETRRQMLATLGRAAREVGFFYLIGHGLSEQEQQETLALAAQLASKDRVAYTRLKRLLRPRWAKFAPQAKSAA